MNQTPESETRKENPHRRYLNLYHKELIERVLSGELTAEEVAKQLTEKRIELEEKTDRDGLTGLLNFQGFTDALAEDLSIVQLYDIPAFLVFLDIDRLKEFNDTMGKMNGNRLIKTYAKVLQDETIKKQSHLSSLIGRFGGDEFVALIIGGSNEDIWQLFEGVRTEIPQAVRKEFDDPTLERTVSIGIVKVNSSDNTLTLLERADNRLNQAKGSRNRIVFEEYPPISAHT